MIPPLVPLLDHERADHQVELLGDAVVFLYEFYVFLSYFLFHCGAAVRTTWERRSDLSRAVDELLVHDHVFQSAPAVFLYTKGMFLMCALTNSASAMGKGVAQGYVVGGSIGER